MHVLVLPLALSWRVCTAYEEHQNGEVFGDVSMHFHVGNARRSQQMKAGFNAKSLSSLLLASQYLPARHHGQTLMRQALTVPSRNILMSSDGMPTRTSEVIRLRDAISQQQISLVGTMHFNPQSVARAKEEILKQDANKLGAVVVEQCLERWKKSWEVAPPGSPQQILLFSEMQAAAGVAIQNDIPIMLGDADAGPLFETLGTKAKKYLGDIVNPLGGWQSIFDDFARTGAAAFNTSDVACSELLLVGEAPLSILDVLQPSILLGIPIALLKYLVSFAVKVPIPFFIFVCIVILLGDVSEAVDGLSGNTDGTIGVLETFFSALYFLALNLIPLRLLAVNMLEERDAVLARSIRRAALEKNGPVVAVLGAAHVNGVARLLMSDATPNADNGETDGVWWNPPDDRPEWRKLV